MFSYFYRRPYLTFALIAAFFIIGVMGLIAMPKNLFPDSDRPQVIVITQIPGATAKVAAATVSKPIEEEIARLGLVREVSSINVANFSIVKGEFEYKKGLDAAAVDVSNALSIARSKLPANANPAIYTSGAFTLPVDVITMLPKDAALKLPDLRKIADSFIKPYLLSKTAIGNVEVFGGYQSAINIAIDPRKAKKYGLDFNKVANAISATDKDMPLGFLKGNNGFFTLTYYGDRAAVDALKHLWSHPMFISKISPTSNGVIRSASAVTWATAGKASPWPSSAHPAAAFSTSATPRGPN